MLSQASRMDIKLEEEALDSAIQQVNEHTKEMMGYLSNAPKNSDKLVLAFKSCSDAVAVLTTANLSVASYDKLYDAVFNKPLAQLEHYLRKEKSYQLMSECYETVQYVSKILPRLYMLVTVGSIFMEVESGPVEDILQDLLPMTLGVQHPIRGLFLRRYLLKKVQGQLRSITQNPNEERKRRFIEFTLKNFVEMNKLWVRHHHQATDVEKEPNGEEQIILRTLVGGNLMEMSELFNQHDYQENVDVILAQVKNCQDKIAQQYILDATAQTFPVPFHLSTIDKFISIFYHLVPGVDVKTILTGLIDRINSYLKSQAETVNIPQKGSSTEASAPTQMLAELTITEPAYENDIDNGWSTIRRFENDEEGFFFNSLFRLLKHLKPLSGSTEKSDLSLADVFDILASLTKLCSTLYPSKLEYMGQMLEFAAAHVEKSVNPPQREILKLIQTILESSDSIYTALAIPNLEWFLSSQPYAIKSMIAQMVTKQIINARTKITTSDELEGVLSILGFLIREEETGEDTAYLAPESSGAHSALLRLGLVSRVVHLVQAPSNEEQRGLLDRFCTYIFDQAGRIPFLAPALITAYLRLARSFKRQDHTLETHQETVESLFQTITNIASAVSEQNEKGMAVRLYSSAAVVADQIGMAGVCLGLFGEAVTVVLDMYPYDKLIPLLDLCSALYGVRNATGHNLTNLFVTVQKQSFKILNIREQAFSLLLSSHLFWRLPTPMYTNEGPQLVENESSKAVIMEEHFRSCLGDALQAAQNSTTKSVNSEILVEVLNRFVYYYGQKKDLIKPDQIKAIVKLIEDGHPSEIARSHLERTLSYLNQRHPDWDGKRQDEEGSNEGWGN